ncbi:hypothetical protein ALO_03336 [Acetonema longum DSM 6540]|uniref:Uncharacterized protein n=1 Tax=Acetonema longum DSM 6540 TaxID=1009370 RepID=F7NF42_9FIRM|nr:hypothetical protein ALO_03336 [Acetonema longum DSM 6540]
MRETEKSAGAWEKSVAYSSAAWNPGPFKRVQILGTTRTRAQTVHSKGYGKRAPAGVTTQMGSFQRSPSRRGRGLSNRQRMPLGWADAAASNRQNRKAICGTKRIAASENNG